MSGDMSKALNTFFFPNLLSKWVGLIDILIDILGIYKNIKHSTPNQYSLKVFSCPGLLSVLHEALWVRLVLYHVSLLLSSSASLPCASTHICPVERLKYGAC